MKTIDIFKATRELIESSPSNKYMGDCSYSRGECTDGSVGCVIGQAILKVNPDFDEWSKIEGHNLYGVGKALGIEDMDIYVEFLLSVQRLQDKGLSWVRAWNSSLNLAFKSFDIKRIEEE